MGSKHSHKICLLFVRGLKNVHGLKNLDCEFTIFLFFFKGRKDFRERKEKQISKQNQGSCLQFPVLLVCLPWSCLQLNHPSVCSGTGPAHTSQWLRAAEPFLHEHSRCPCNIKDTSLNIQMGNAVVESYIHVFSCIYLCILFTG